MLTTKVLDGGPVAGNKSVTRELLAGILLLQTGGRSGRESLRSSAGCTVRSYGASSQGGGGRGEG